MNLDITIICCLLLAHEYPSPHDGVPAIAVERMKHAIPPHPAPSHHYVPARMGRFQGYEGAA